MQLPLYFEHGISARPISAGPCNTRYHADATRGLCTAWIVAGFAWRDPALDLVGDSHSRLASPQRAAGGHSLNGARPVPAPCTGFRGIVGRVVLHKQLKPFRADAILE